MFGSGRVLVIDDTAEVRRTVERSLRRTRLTVEVAADGEEGLAKVRAEIPDLVLTDVNMPGIDGFEVLSAIRNDPRTATVPVVLLTGVDDRASVRRGMALGADDYLTKPFTPEELRDTVRARLEHRSRLSAAYLSKLEEKQHELRAATHTDAETGLPNRLAFREALERARDPLSVLVIALDRFDRLQTAFHPSRPSFVENTLRELGARMARAAAPNEAFRLGGSRFAIVGEHAPDARAAEELAHAVLSEIRTPLSGTELELRVTASIGIAVWSGEPPEGAIAVAGHAEAAAYHARESGGNHVEVYDGAQHHREYNRLVLESGMHRALERDQFELHYQSQVSAETQEIVGVEALIRWRHPELGMVSPFHFIPIAEDTGLIVEIGAWVLRTACADVARWSESFPGLRVAVNLSALQLRDERLVDLVKATLAETGLPPQQLELELTESMMVEAGPQAAERLKMLRAIGVGVSIDDFGTGYSSLSNLRALPIGEVKIDRSFVRHVPDDRDNCSIVSAVIAMAHQLGLRVVAEGVEEEAQLAFLRERQCDVIQGYYFSKPIPAAEFVAFAQGFATR
jgi:EAL domain-containing protein (putative c-di-GMP-specific phosphodiesterase class I)/DNA-binding response OmpR family regulator